MSKLTNAQNLLAKIIDEENTATNMDLIPSQATNLASMLFSLDVPTLSGYNVVYGTTGDDVVNLSVPFVGAFIPQFSPTWQLIPTTPTIDTSAVNPFGNTLILGGQGNDVLIGGISPSIFGFPPSSSIIISGNGNDILMGGFFTYGNTLIAGNGNDQLYGTIATYVVAPAGSGPLPPLNGNNLIAGNGNDLLVGLTGYVNITTDGTLGGNNSNWVSTSLWNTLTAGHGNDILVGSIMTLNSLTENTSNVTSTSTSGGHILTAGNGNDILIGNNMTGDERTENASNVTQTSIFRGYTLTAGNGNDLLVGLDLSVTVTFSNVTSSSYTDLLGNSHLTAGNGNDTLIGGAEIFNEIFTGCSGTNVHFYGNDILTAGNGNDLLVGNVKTLSISIDNNNLWFQEEHWGNVTLTAGNGNDILIGNVLDNSAVSAQDKQFFGNDVLTVGNGKDILVGDDTTGIAAGSPATVKVWGNDVITAGTVADKFMEALDDHTGSMGMQGADIITKFNPVNDTLVFGNVMDVNGGGISASDLDMQATFVNFMVHGEHELAVIFHGSGAANATAYANAIQAFVNADTGSTLHILADVAQYIYQSGTATALTGASYVFYTSTNSTDMTPQTVNTLANDASSTLAPNGALILEGHSTSDTGFSSFADLASHYSGALSLQSGTLTAMVNAAVTAGNYIV
jgi:Ca2+-binding RTX toxin-like protein